MRLCYAILPLVIAGCSTTQTTKDDTTPSAQVSSLTDIPTINRDSLLDYLAIRYDRLTEERRQAYATKDSTLRAQRLMLNDKHSSDFADSLRFAVSLPSDGR